MLNEFFTRLYVSLSTRRNEEGATAAEYGLLIALIAVVMAVGAKLLGEEIRDLFKSINLL